MCSTMDQTVEWKFPSTEEIDAEYDFLLRAANVFLFGLKHVTDILIANKLITKCRALREDSDVMVQFNGLFFTRFATKSIKKIGDGKRAEVLNDWLEQQHDTRTEIFKDIEEQELMEALKQDFLKNTMGM